MGGTSPPQSTPWRRYCKKLFVLTSENLVTVTSVKEATLVFEARDDTEEKIKEMFEKFLVERSVKGLYCAVTQLCYKLNILDD